MYQVTGSIVLYHNRQEDVMQTIVSFLNTKMNIKLYLIDNSETDSLKNLSKYDKRIEYIFNNKNLGYGSAHNIAMREALGVEAEYHLVLNPDIHFSGGVLEEVYEHMNRNESIGNIMPKVIYPNGSVQYLCKLLPTPVDLILRRFIPFKSWKERRNNKYELKFSGYNKEVNIPSLSGCFMFLRVDALRNVGLFDEKIFMYLEDVDLVRRLHEKYKTTFYPNARVVHEYEKGSYKNKKLLFFHIKSAIYYFNKWGWFFDKKREVMNEKCLKKLNYYG